MIPNRSKRLTLIGLSIVSTVLAGCGTANRTFARGESRLFTADPNLSVQPILDSQQLSLAGNDRLGAGIARTQLARENRAAEQFVLGLTSVEK